MLENSAFRVGEPETLRGEIQYREIFDVVLDHIARNLSMSFYNLSMYAGNSKEYVVLVKDRDLVPIDLTGGSAVMTWKTTKDATTNSLQVSGTIPMPTNGEVRFDLSPSNTVSLTPRQYVFDVKVTVNSRVFTVLEGVITLKKPVS